MKGIEAIRTLATTVTAVIAAAAALVMVGRLAGPLVSLAVAVALLAIVGVLIAQRVIAEIVRVHDAVERIENETRPNGSDEQLPLQLQGKPTRSLVIWCVTHIQQQEARLAAGDGHFELLDEEMRRHRQRAEGWSSEGSV